MTDSAKNAPDARSGGVADEDVNIGRKDDVPDMPSSEEAVPAPPDPEDGQDAEGHERPEEDKHPDDDENRQRSE